MYSESVTIWQLQISSTINLMQQEQMLYQFKMVSFTLLIIIITAMLLPNGYRYINDSFR